MDAGNSSDVHEVSSENELYSQRYDMDQCVPFDGDSVSNESDVEDWLQLDPGNLDDILGTEELEPLSTCPSPPRNPSPFTYGSETYSMKENIKVLQMTQFYPRCRYLSKDLSNRIGMTWKMIIIV